jgi:hypothetical protein
VAQVRQFNSVTNGSQTWVNGPLGLQQRADNQRFWWEINPDGLTIIPPPLSGDRWHTAGLALAVQGVDAGAGNLVGTFDFTNQLDVSCTFFGYPGAQLRDAADNPMPSSVGPRRRPFVNDPPAATVVVPPHQAAQFSYTGSRCRSEAKPVARCPPAWP